MDTNTVQLIESFGNKLDSYIQTIASKAGVAADHFYPVFVKQQAIDGYCQLGLLLLLIILLLILLKYFSVYVGLANSDNTDEVRTPSTIKSIVSGMVGVFVMISIGVNLADLPETIGKIANPEYYAVQSLVQMIK